MTRNVFFRDFTTCKAVALVGLIGLALVLSATAKPASELAQAPEVEAPQVMPVVYTIFEKDCDTDKVGVDL